MSDSAVACDRSAESLTELVCPICRSSKGKMAPAIPDYWRCAECEHEFRTCAPKESFIVNDTLETDSVEKFDLLEKFKKKLVDRYALDRSFLLDIGCATGKFLFHQHKSFSDHLGIEVTPECKEFATSVLGLKVADNIAALNSTPSLVTFWHTLEHIPADIARDVLKRIREKSSATTRVIISVPNAQARLYRWFGPAYPYYDPESHVHQFTPRSLNLLMEGCGFKLLAAEPSLAYSAFGYLQALLNLSSPIRNYWYYRQKRGWDFGLTGEELKRGDLKNSLMLPLCAPFAGIGVAMDFIDRSRGAVINQVYGVS